VSGDLDFDTTTPVCDVPLDDDAAVIEAGWYGPEIALGVADTDAKT
jgi:hypothetical protein